MRDAWCVNRFNVFTHHAPRITFQRLRALTSLQAGVIFQPSMQEIIEKLLILQDRDRRILRVTQELAHIGPEREGLRARATATQGQLQAAKLRVNQIESERKQRDLEIEAKKSQIEKYQIGRAS